MTVHYADDWLTVLLGDCRDELATLPAESVHCVVTSPPYWGLRDYGIGERGLGLEPTPEAYVEAMVAVFREVRRVLRRDGTLWLNIGDSYASSGTPGPNSGLADLADQYAPRVRPRNPNRDETGSVPRPAKTVPSGLKPKDLVGIPWRLAFALQADGWYLRSDIIWSKPNPMPESVTDRPTKAHEYLFLLTRSPRYYYDADAVREESSPFSRPQGPNGGPRRKVVSRHVGLPRERGDGTGLAGVPYMGGRNLRSVWTIPTQPYPGAHFATFPEALVEPCIKAGTSERGVCPECGAPWVRETSVEQVPTQRTNGREKQEEVTGWDRDKWPRTRKLTETTGWRPSCLHYDIAAYPDWLKPDAVIPATVLDPFAGSGTTGRVANRLSRRAILIDLSADYLDQAMLRNHQTPLGLAQ